MAVPRDEGPSEVVLRREGFAARFGGLRYDVRRSVGTRDSRFDSVRRWQFDLDAGDAGRAERGGWSYGWVGEHVSSPVAYRAHTDGRVGYSFGGAFGEVRRSFEHMIECHALTDELAAWEPVSGGALETWSGSAPPGELTAGLDPVPEACGLR